MKIIAHLQDNQYPFSYIDHIRTIARGVVINDKNQVALIKLHGFDSFGDRNYYELPGGGVKENEKISDAFMREIREELGFEVTILDEIGQVRDFYNLIHRENHNYYFLGKANRYVGVQLDEYEKTMFEKALWLSIDDAIKCFQEMHDDGVSGLVKSRELPILLMAKKWMGSHSL
ncbi:MAG TPA: NUDIX hydrolase [Bacilli bacterium]|nr:NUDIX hydrolase [Bacilli bacterium]HPS18815.1 NUDIX hydrolase [Bacilli bacterium]